MCILIGEFSSVVLCTSMLSLHIMNVITGNLILYQYCRLETGLFCSWYPEIIFALSSVFFVWGLAGVSAGLLGRHLAHSESMGDASAAVVGITVHAPTRQDGRPRWLVCGGGDHLRPRGGVHRDVGRDGPRLGQDELPA